MARPVIIGPGWQRSPMQRANRSTRSRRGVPTASAVSAGMTLRGGAFFNQNCMPIVHSMWQVVGYSFVSRSPQGSDH